MKQNIIHSIIRRGLILMMLSLLVPIGVGAQDAVITVGGYAPEQFEQQFGSTVSFDATTNTLTLNNATISGGYNVGGCIISSCGALTIKLIGENLITSTDSCTAIRATGGNQTLTIVPQAQTASLTLKAERCIRDFYELNLTNMVWAGENSYEYGQGNFGYGGNGYGLLEASEGEVNANQSGITLRYFVDYGLWLGSDNQVTSDNRTNILDTDVPTAQFDGDHTLILNGAGIFGAIELSKTYPNGLIIYLKGENTITGTSIVSNTSQSEVLPAVTFKTDAKSPGSLTFTHEGGVAQLNSVDDAFLQVTQSYQNGLAATLGNSQAGPQVITIVPTLVPVVDETGDEETLDGGGEGLGKALEAQTTATQVITDDKKMLMTLGSDDGFFNWTPSTTGDDAGLWDGDENAKLVVLSTEQDDVPEDKEPCTAAFNEAFKGIAMVVPAGVYDVTCNYKNIGNGRLVVQAGRGEKVSKALFELKVSHGDATHRLTLQEPGHIYIYNTKYTPVFSRGRAPGRKMANTTSLKSVKVSARSCASAPPPPASPVTLTKADVAAAKSDNHITVTDVNVVGFADDAFAGQTGITYVDLSATSISSLTVDRNKLPQNAIILLPAGNDAGTAKNVVIGGVCEDLELSDERTFDIPSGFTAVKVAQTRTYTAGQNSTICLPYALDATQVAALGTFYEPTAMSMSEHKVTMTSVEKTDANTPYMFKPKAGVTKVSAEMVDVKKPTGAQVPGSNGFIGTFTAMSINSGTKQYYCFSDTGIFWHVTSAVNVLPFRAYFELGAALGRSLDIDYGDGTTGISNVQSSKFNDQSYYDLQGRRVLYPKKGLYILNGKKVIIK